MKKEIESKIGSTIYNRLLSIRMSDAERQRALSAMYDAEMVVDGFTWIVKKIERLGAGLFLKPATLKH